MVLRHLTVEEKKSGLQSSTNQTGKTGAYQGYRFLSRYLPFSDSRRKNCCYHVRDEPPKLHRVTTINRHEYATATATKHREHGTRQHAATTTQQKAAAASPTSHQQRASINHQQRAGTLTRRLILRPRLLCYSGPGRWGVAYTVPGNKP